MSDRELLELAAKAAGYTLARVTFTGAPHVDLGFMCDTGSSFFGPWDPLKDDGDALKLAAKLGMTVWFHAKGARAECRLWNVSINLHGTDNLAASRRAIVRAAADIGRAMP